MTTVTTVTKNPKNVERGKKSYETHLQRMKASILADTSSDTCTTPTHTPTPTPTDTCSTPTNTCSTPIDMSIILLAVLAIGGLGVYFYNQSTPPKKEVAEQKKEVEFFIPHKYQ